MTLSGFKYRSHILPRFYLTLNRFPYYYPTSFCPYQFHRHGTHLSVDLLVNLMPNTARIYGAAIDIYIGFIYYILIPPLPYFPPCFFSERD